jgi:hypothetical protein
MVYSAPLRGYKVDKRRTTRVPFNIESAVKYQGKTIKGEAINLSLKGMMFKGSEEIPLNTALDIVIFLTGTTSQLTINLKGTVVRIDKVGTAIESKEIDIDSFIHLKNIVAYNDGNQDKIMEEFYKSMKSE